MNLAVFAPYDLAAHGGIASHIRAQARALRALGHRVTVFGPASAPLADGAVAVSGSTTVTFGGTSSGASFDPRVFRRVPELFARQPFDVVHVHEPLMPLLPWAAVWAARAPVVATFHVFRENGHRWYPIARPLLRRVLDRIAARIAVSDAARQTVATAFPGDYDIIPNGIEVRRFQAPLPRPRTVSALDAMVLYVGRLEPRKGVATLIDAMAQVGPRVGATLVVVGDGPERAALEARAMRAGTRVIFVTDVTDEELPAYYQAADVVCAPAIGGESFGIVLIEALAAGKPVVASRIDGYRAAIGASSCVRWVDPGNVAALADALVLLLEDRRMTWRAEAVRIASAYDWTRIAQRLVSVYHRVEGAAPRSAVQAYRR